jgi:hypothetical protein
MFVIGNNKLITCLLTIGIVISILHLFLPIPFIFGGIFISLSVLFMYIHLSLLIKIQVSIFSALGIISMAIGEYYNIDVNWQKSLSMNIPLICIILGSSMLKLICVSSNNSIQEVGKKGVIQTLISSHIFSSVINISALYISADFFSRKYPLNTVQSAILTRAFTLSMLWSPMLAGMAIAFTWSPDASMTNIMYYGIPLALFGMIFTYFEIIVKENSKFKNFQGVSLSLDDMIIPLSLTVFVLLINSFFYISSIPLLVAGSCILLVIIKQYLDLSSQGIVSTWEFASKQLPSMKNEVSLFLAAGIFAQGISTLFSTFMYSDAQLIIGWQHCALILCTIVALASLGLHPIASIAIIGSWLQTTDFPPDLVAFTFITAWSLGSLASPFSGTSMALTQRYGIPLTKVRSSNRWFIITSLTLYIFTMIILDYS